MIIDYDEVNAELMAVRAGVRASECHGFLCGYFCASNSIAADSWQDNLLAGIDDAADLEDCFNILSRLANQVSEQIPAEEIAFNIFLPDDETAISERSSALAEWCAGFISGVGIGGLSEKSQLPEECNEFIKDVVSLSRMETVLEDSEDAENDLFEIIEYLRVGVIMLHQECHSANSDYEKPEVLH